jgi:hypothetical protein
MRRIVFTTAASVVVIALAPASAMARGHHKRHHSRTHARVRHELFGNVTTPTTTTPTTPTTPTPPADAAGTVDSFTNGLLVIKLNDGSTVSGMVTSNTEIECEMTQPTTATGGDDGDQSGGGGDEGSGGSTQGSGGGDQGSGGGDQGSGGGDQGASAGTQGSGGDDQGDGSDEQGQTNQTCTTADLTPGAFIRGAELGISSAGATWDKVDLIL